MSTLELLTHHLVLQLLVQPKAARASLSELPECVAELQRRSDSNGAARVVVKHGKSAKAATAAKEKQKQADDEAQERPALVEVVIDILLTLLVQPSAMLRDVCKQVLRSFADDVNEEAISQLLDVLRAPLVGAEGEDDDDDDDDDDDVEELDDDDDDNDDDEDDGDGDDDDDDDDDASEDGGDLREALGVLGAMESALGVGKPDAKGARLDDDDDDESDEELPDDPEAMAALDKQLGAVLRARLDSQRASNERREQQLHFRLRVLDLMDSLARRQTPSPLLLLLPLPLLKLLGESSSSPAHRVMAERIGGLLRNRLSKMSFKPPWKAETLAPIKVLEQLEGVMQLAAKQRSAGAQLVAAIVDAVLLLLRVLSQNGFLNATALADAAHAGNNTAGESAVGTAADADSASNAKSKKQKKRAREAQLECLPCGDGDGGGGQGSLNSAVYALLRNSLEAYYSQKNCRLSGKLVAKLMERTPLLGWSLAPMLVTKVAGARDAFLCGEACTHMGILLQQKPAMGEGANRLISVLPALQEQLLLLLARDGLKSKHVLPPIRLAQALLRTLQATNQMESAKQLAAAVAPEAKAIAEKQGANARSLAGNCANLRQLCDKVLAADDGGAPAKRGKKEHN